IGLKRAIFKMGNRIKIVSDHSEGGFSLDLNVAEWAKDTTQPWTIDITQREPCSAEKSGTSITVTELYDEVGRRIDDGVFLNQLKAAISRTYAYYINKFVTISVNDEVVDGIDIQIGQNHISETFTFSDV